MNPPINFSTIYCNNMAIFRFIGRATSNGNTLLSDNTKPYVYWLADQTVFDGQVQNLYFAAVGGKRLIDEEVHGHRTLAT